MTGFQLTSTGDPAQDCLVYLLPQLKLDSPEKFWTAVAVSFGVAFLCPDGLRLLRRRAWSMKARDSEQGPLSRLGILLLVKGTDVMSVTHAYGIMLLTMTFSVEIFA